MKLTEEMLNPDPGDEPEAPEDGGIIVHKSNVRKKTLSFQFCIKFCILHSQPIMMKTENWQETDLGRQGDIYQ